MLAKLIYCVVVIYSIHHAVLTGVAVLQSLFRDTHNMSNNTRVAPIIDRTKASEIASLYANTFLHHSTSLTFTVNWGVDVAGHFLSPCCPVHHLICAQTHDVHVSLTCVFPSGLWMSSYSF